MAYIGSSIYRISQSGFRVVNMQNRVYFCMYVLFINYTIIFHMNFNPTCALLYMCAYVYKLLQ